MSHPLHAFFLIINMTGGSETAPLQLRVCQSRHPPHVAQLLAVQPAQPLLLVALTSVAV